MQFRSLRIVPVTAAYAYGIWIAAVYILLRHSLGDKLVPAFSAGATLGGAALCLWDRRSVWQSVCNPICWIRGGLFGASQIFLLRALLLGDSTTVFAASSSAILVSLPLSSVVLGDNIKWKDCAAAGLAISGVMILAPESGVTINSLAAGIFQGASVVVARRAGIVKSPLFGNLALGLLLAGVMCLSLDSSAIHLIQTNPLIPVSVGAVAIVTQLYLLWLSFNFTPNFVNQVSQTRIFWSMLIMAGGFAQTASAATFGGAILIFIAATITFNGPHIASTSVRSKPPS